MIFEEIFKKNTKEIFYQYNINLEDYDSINFKNLLEKDISTHKI